MTTTTELEPQFAVTVRGYDRAHVDEYVDTLREWLANATQRMEAAEFENNHLREEVVVLRARAAQMERQHQDGPPRTIEALGDRVSAILLLAEEGAQTLRADADAEAVSILGRARQEASDLVHAAEGRKAEMEAFIAGAAEQAAAIVRQAESRGAEAASRLLGEAEARTTRCEAEAAERAKALVAAAETDRDRILAQLHERQAVLQFDLQRLEGERNEAVGALTKLRESLNRTISGLPGAGMAPPPGATPATVTTTPPGTTDTTSKAGYVSATLRPASPSFSPPSFSPSSIPLPREG
ncbi:MAG: DivIVA domain-containing protein [Acidimicrobiales bacterium]